MTSTLPAPPAPPTDRTRSCRRSPPRPTSSWTWPAAVDRFVDLAAALPGTAVHYAVKANPHPRCSLSSPRSGAGSTWPAPPRCGPRSARGAPPAGLVYSNPVKRRDHIVEAAALGVRLFVVDSLAETRKVAEAAPGSQVLCRLVTSGEGSDWPLSRKYGCSTYEAVEILTLADELGLDAAGVSFHVGSQQRDPEAWAAPIAAVGPSSSSCASAGCTPGCSTWAAASRRRTTTAAVRSRRTARPSNGTSSRPSAAPPADDRRARARHRR